MAYIQLPSGKVKNKPERTILGWKINITEYNTEFYISQLYQVKNAFDSNFQRNLISNIGSNEDVQKYLLTSGKIDKHM